MGLKLFTRRVIFPEMGVSKKRSTFYAGSRRSVLERAMGAMCMSIAPPNPILIKRREALWCYFSVLAFYWPPPGKFSADTLESK